jgi:hypothetical protein
MCYANHSGLFFACIWFDSGMSLTDRRWTHPRKFTSPEQFLEMKERFCNVIAPAFFQNDRLTMVFVSLDQSIQASREKKMKLFPAPPRK